MNITVEQIQGLVPVTILSTHGDLDASNYQDLIRTAKEVYASGARDILVDMSDTSFMSSSGLVALHSIASLLKGGKPADPEAGWEAFHAIQRDLDAGLQRHVKLANLQPKVDRALSTTGMKQFFEVYPDRESALASFQ